MKITLDWLVQRGACAAAREAFAAKFPDGATYTEIQAALHAGNRADWSWWLVDALYHGLLDSPADVTTQNVDAHIDMARKIIAAAPPSAIETPTPYAAQIGSSGDAARIGSSGNAAQIGSSGDAARIGSSGNDARIGSSGDAARIGSSGDAARIGSSGNDARIGSSGNDAQIVATGENATIVCAGSNARVKAGKDGCFALTWHDGNRNRIVVGYVGEDGIKADTWYHVNAGKLVEAS